MDYSSLSRVCIIPARGGSKRIPGKNIRPFLGKPVIYYAIQTALESNLFDEVMVSTDDEEIRQIALESGATVPFLRSKENASDTATTVSVLLEVLDQYEKIGREYKCGCCLYPVTPLTTVSHLHAGWQLIQSQDFDTVLPVLPFSFPIWRSVKRLGEQLKWIWPEHAMSRSQDLPMAYHDAGQWYWFQTVAIQTKKTLYTDYTGSILLDEMQVQDVDNESDWQVLELKYKSKSQ